MSGLTPRNVALLAIVVIIVLVLAFYPPLSDVLVQSVGG